MDLFGLPALCAPRRRPQAQRLFDFAHDLVRKVCNFSGSCANYQYSVFQLELSRNLLFLARTMMGEVYQKLIERTRVPLALKQVKTIFGFPHRPHQTAKRGRERTEVFNAVQAQSYDLTVFKIKGAI